MRERIPCAWPQCLANVGAGKLARRFLACLVLHVGACISTLSAELRLGHVGVPPGAVVSVPVTCSDPSGAVAAQFDVNFNSSAVSLTSIAAGAGMAGYIVDRRELSPGRWRVLVYSPTNGPIAPGTVVWLSFNIPTNAPNGAIPLLMDKAIVAQVAGKRLLPLDQVDGALLVSSVGSFLAIALESGGGLSIRFQGLPGGSYVFEASTNLANWIVLGPTNTTSDGMLNLRETNQLAFPQRFYRARRVP